jgi:hypothetical protein
MAVPAGAVCPNINQRSQLITRHSKPIVDPGLPKASYPPALVPVYLIISTSRRPAHLQHYKTLTVLAMWWP